MIEYVLATLLICLMPARALHKSMREKRNETSRFKTYIQSSAIIIGLLALLCYAWFHAARSPGNLAWIFLSPSAASWGWPLPLSCLWR